MMSYAPSEVLPKPDAVRPNVDNLDAGCFAHAGGTMI